MKNGYLKREAEGTGFAAQDQALNAKQFVKKLNGEDLSPMCRLCGGAEETIARIVSGCHKLV